MAMKFNIKIMIKVFLFGEVLKILKKKILKITKNIKYITGLYLQALQKIKNKLINLETLNLKFI